MRNRSLISSLLVAALFAVVAALGREVVRFVTRGHF